MLVIGRRKSFRVRDPDYRFRSMHVPKRITVFAFLLCGLSNNAVAGSWINEHLVHRTPSFTEAGAQSCLTCHAAEKMRAIAGSAHGDPEHPKSPAALQQCETCHGPGSIHVSRAHGGKGFPPLTVFGYGKGAASRNEQVAVCMECHRGDNDIKSVVYEGTLHDRMIINCSACHTAHIGPDPVLERKNQPQICFRCHIKQKDEHPRTGSRVPDFDRMGCAGCHRVHRLPEPGKGEG